MYKGRLLSNAGTGGKLVLQGSILMGYRWTSGLTSGTQGLDTAGPNSVRHMQSGWDGVQFDLRDTAIRKSGNLMALYGHPIPIHQVAVARHFSQWQVPRLAVRPVYMPFT